MNQSQELTTAIAAAKAGGEVILEYLEKGFSSREKLDAQQSQGLVTQADLDAEKTIVATIKEIFPSHNFLGEETHSDDVGSEHLWIIDPLDGTNNFAHGIPHFGVSVAYYRSGVAVCGAVLNPTTSDLYVAEQGRGAFHDGERVSVNDHTELNETMIATGFYYDRGKLMESTLAAIGDLFRQNVHGIRRFGAATLDLVDVGLGRYGGFFELTLSPWDFAAAKLFVEEAGGKVTTCSGSDVPLHKTSILASNSELHSQLLNVIGPHAMRGI